MLTGRYCDVVPLVEGHLPDLHRALDVESPGSIWAYYAEGPFTDQASFDAYVLRHAAARREHLRAFVVEGRALGLAAYLRVLPEHGSVEVGGIVMGSELSRTTAATEAMYLMMRHAFDDLGYRRYEWKCDSANAASVAAARRLGFVSEGTHRNAVVYRGRNRDTAWFSITDDEWPAVRSGLERWLDPSNFDAEGAQRTRLRFERPPDQDDV